LTLIILELDEEEEGVAKPQPKAKVAITSRVLRACFRSASIDINEEMDHVEKINGSSMQLKSLKQPKISLTLLPTLRVLEFGPTSSPKSYTIPKENGRCGFNSSKTIPHLL
jgi:hypothetical protein